MDAHTIPTGHLIVDQYSRGPLETLSIGDYGKQVNVKADFLGLTRDIDGVPDGPIMPLSEKWVVTLSTQYGCPMRCTFCDVPNLRFNGNATFEDLQRQLYSALRLHPEVRYAGRLNVHRMPGRGLMATTTIRRLPGSTETIQVVLTSNPAGGPDSYRVTLPDGTPLGTATRYESRISYRRGPKMRRQFTRREFWKGTATDGRDYRLRESRADLIRQLLDAAGL